MKKDKKTLIILVVLTVQFIIAFEMNVVMPLGPYISTIYNVELSQITYLNILYALFGLFSPLVGFIAEKKGSKLSLSFIMGSFVVGSFLVFQFNDVLSYMIGRGLMGLCMVSMMGLGLNYMISIMGYNRAGTISGLFRIVQGLAILSAPMIGSAIVQHINFKAIHGLLFISMLTCFILFIIFANKTQVVPQKLELKAVLNEVNNYSAKRMLVVSLLATLPSVLFFSYLSVHLVQSPTMAQSITSVYTLVALGAVLGGVFITFFGDKVKKENLLFVLIALIPLALIGFLNSQSTGIYVFGILFGFLFDAANGLIFPVARNKVKKYVPTYMTLLSFMISISTVFSSAIGPTLYKINGFTTIILFISVGLLLAAYIVASIIIKEKETNYGIQNEN